MQAVECEPLVTGEEEDEDRIKKAHRWQLQVARWKTHITAGDEAVAWCRQRWACHDHV